MVSHQLLVTYLMEAQFLGAAGSPLFGSIAIGRKKRSNSEEISNNLQIIRERLIRTGKI